MLGGHSAAKEATPEVQQVADQVRSQVQTKTNKTYTTFKLINYTTQVVAGLIYTMKIQVGDNDFIHLKVFREPKEDAVPQVQEVYEGKSETDPLHG